MGLGASIFLIALGAILRFAITATVSGINLHTVGVILMIIGLIGLVLSLIFWSTLGFGRRTVVREERDVYDDRDRDDIDRVA